jgi:phosphonate transport system substrate-binding protein
MKLVRIYLLILFFSTVGFTNSLKIGVTPYTSAMKIIKIYKPLTQFLSHNLNTNVEVYSSKNYKSFYSDVEKGTFDIVITSPHFGVLHMENGFTPLYRYNTALNLLFVVSKNSPYYEISDLKNTTIATPNFLSALNIGSIKTLLDNGLINGKNFKLEDLGSHTSAIKCVVIKECDAAITTYSPLKQFSDQELLKTTRIIKSQFQMPHLFTLMNPKYSKDKIITIKKVLKEFENSKEGKVFFEKTGYKGYTTISEKDKDALMQVSKVTKEYLGLP